MLKKARGSTILITLAVTKCFDFLTMGKFRDKVRRPERKGLHLYIVLSSLISRFSVQPSLCCKVLLWTVGIKVRNISKLDVYLLYYVDTPSTVFDSLIYGLPSCVQSRRTTCI